MTELDLGEPTEIPEPDYSNDSDPAPRKVPSCEVCGVELDYSGRGRPPTKCAEHKSTKTSPTGTKPPRKGTRTKAQIEAEQLAHSLHSGLTKGSLYLGALVDPYDGFALMVGSKELTKQFQGVMETHEAMRKELLALGSGGSIIGLIFAVMGIALPIAAHHGVIPKEVNGKPVGALIENMPKMLVKLEKATENAEGLLAREMERQMTEGGTTPNGNPSQSS